MPLEIWPLVNLATIEVMLKAPPQSPCQHCSLRLRVMHLCLLCELPLWLKPEYYRTRSWRTEITACEWNRGSQRCLWRSSRQCISPIERLSIPECGCPFCFITRAFESRFQLTLLAYWFLRCSKSQPPVMIRPLVTMNRCQAWRLVCGIPPNANGQRMAYLLKCAFET